MLYKIIKKGNKNMDTILKFDRVILVKELNDKFKKVGEVFEVANILGDSFLLRDAKTRVAIGVVSFSDFEKHFVAEDGLKGWTKWQPLTGFDNQTDALYRTNRYKVQVKFITDNIRAEASCCKGDDFNLFFGVQLAYLRALNKALAKQKVEYEDKFEDINEKIKDINVQITDNKRIIRSMINSLEGSNEVV